MLLLISLALVVVRPAHPLNNNATDIFITSSRPPTTDAEYDDRYDRSGRELRIELDTSRIRESNTVIEDRIKKLVTYARKRAEESKYKLPRTDWNAFDESFTNDSSSFSVEIVRTEPRPNALVLYADVYLNGQTIEPETISRDISLLSSELVSAIIRYPVRRVNSPIEAAAEGTQTWWILGLILGGGALTLLLGWCLLFFYFNTCGRLSWGRGEDKEAAVIYQREGEEDAGLEDTSHAAAPRVEERRQIPPLRLSPSLEGHRREEGNFSAIPEATPVGDVDSKEKQRTASPTGSLEIIEDSVGGEELLEDPEITSSRREDRPKTAGIKRPIRTIDGRVIGMSPRRTSATGILPPGQAVVAELFPADPNGARWTPYSAGDRVNALYSIRPPSTFDQPTPIPPTLTGEISLSTKNERPTVRFI